MKDTSMSDLGILQEGSQHVSRTSMLSSSLLNVNPRNQLLQARDILELGLKNVSFARQAVALADGKSIADVSWAKVCVFDNLDFSQISNLHIKCLISLYFKAVFIGCLCITFSSILSPLKGWNIRGCTC